MVSIKPMDWLSKSLFPKSCPAHPENAVDGVVIFRASLHCFYTVFFLEGGVRVPPQPQEPRRLLDWLEGVANPDPMVSELWIGVQSNVRLCTYMLRTRIQSLSPCIWMTFLAHCECLTLLSRECPRKQITRSSTKKALCRCPWQYERGAI